MGGTRAIAFDLVRSIGHGISLLSWHTTRVVETNNPARQTLYTCRQGPPRADQRIESQTTCQFS